MTAVRHSRHRLARALVFVFALSVLVLPAHAWSVAEAQAAPEVVVTLGANLDQGQRQEMLDLFGVEDGDATVLEVTNAEEREYLEGSVPDEQIGTRAISSAYVRVKDDGSGVDVQTKNITYITPRTYANALVTAGIADADVYAAAPFEVSGTAALTGIFKAFEVATGQEIPEAAKDVATQEMVDTAEVGEQTGDPDAIANLVEQAKQEIVEQGLDNPEAIREVVIRIAAELQITLTEDQIDKLVQVLVAVQSLDLDVDKVRQQLKDFQDSIGLSDAQAQGIWEQIKDVFNSIWEAIFG